MKYLHVLLFKIILNKNQMKIQLFLDLNLQTLQTKIKYE